MSQNRMFGDGPTTEGEFERVLIELIRSAHSNEVNVEGGWLDRNPERGSPDWGIEICEVTKPS